MRPGIILTSKFITPKSSSRKDYSSYIKYINRKDAIEKDENKPEVFGNYLDYMNDRKKDAYGFDNHSNNLMQDQVRLKKKVFDEAREDKRILWQDVYSFDNKFLEDEGLYNSKTNTLDDDKLIDAVRTSMSKFQKDTNINHLEWTGAIHRNTDNIHVHVASVTKDENIERDEEGIQRGYRSEKTLNNMKSAFVNRLVDRNKRLDLMTEHRDELVHLDFTYSKKRKEKDQLDEIKRMLPENKNKWQYNRKDMNHVRHLIDDYTESYIKKHHSKQYKAYTDLLDEEVEFNKRLYGEGTKKFEKYKDSKVNKLNELNERMGNQLLKELKNETSVQKHMNDNQKDYSYESYKQRQKNFSNENVQSFKRKSSPIITRRNRFMMERSLNSRYKDQQLDMDHKRLEKEIEMQKSQAEYD